MLVFSRENVRAYINNDPTSHLGRSNLFNLLLCSFVFGLPTALVGIYADVTRLTMLPILTILTIWNIYLRFGFEKKTASYILYLGSTSTLISLSALVAAYKFLSTITIVPLGAVIVVLAIYILAIILTFIFVSRLIAQGHFLKSAKKPPYNIMVIISAWLISSSIARSLNDQAVNQDAVVVVLSSLMFFFSLCFSLGSHQFLRYHLMRKLADQPESDLLSIW